MNVHENMTKPLSSNRALQGAFVRIEEGVKFSDVCATSRPISNNVGVGGWNDYDDNHDDYYQDCPGG